ncbi:MAG: hypothetical protein QM528_05085 [Phycisphaerales bacterium]|nr:hypothetical protein [Phycisphaerales bacterium]
MKQIYTAYVNEDQAIWTYLFERQEKLLVDKASNEYLNCLKRLEPVLNKHKIPNFEQLNEYLYKANGWVIEVVEGLIEPNEFFNLLSQKRFPASTWLRDKAHLDYLQEPDMFHDIFGHIPLLMNTPFSQYVFEYAQLAKCHTHNEMILKQMQRLYWFTIEFGVIKELGQTRIYGAGILSSIEESKFIFSEKAHIYPFHLDDFIMKEYRIDILQENYYQINSFTDLWEHLKEYERLYLNHVVAPTP